MSKKRQRQNTEVTGKCQECDSLHFPEKSDEETDFLVGDEMQRKLTFQRARLPRSRKESIMTGGTRIGREKDSRSQGNRARMLTGHNH